jgi:hypothetical protein
MDSGVKTFHPAACSEFTIIPALSSAVKHPGVLCQHLEQVLLVIPAQAGIQIATLDSRLRGNDGTPNHGTPKLRFDKAKEHFLHSPITIFKAQ